MAVFTYYRDANRRRAEWLISFYEKFCEEPQYKRIRYLLDYRPPEYEELERVVKSGQADERADLIVDYLNFFEFVGSLWRLHQISLRDVRMLFEYDLKNIRSHDWLREFVKDQGLESLDLLLEEIDRPG